jgi:hypothetical protein
VPFVACHPIEPGFLPDQIAGGIAAVVRAAVTTQAHQQDAAVDAPHLARPAIVVDPVQDPVHARRATTEGLHLLHERQAVQLAGRIERRLNLLIGLDADAVA